MYDPIGVLLAATIYTFGRDWLLEDESVYLIASDKNCNLLLILLNNMKLMNVRVFYIKLNFIITNYIIKMISKPLVLLAILIFLCSVDALHTQKFAPSTPGGVYEGANGTTSGTNNTQQQSTTIPLINGRPYVYAGPFTLVCYYQNSTNVFRFDNCYDEVNCYYMLLEYSQCVGKVMKYKI